MTEATDLVPVVVPRKRSGPARITVPDHERRGIRTKVYGHLPRGVWHAELVDVVRAYPKTQEAYDAMRAARLANIEKQRAAGRWNRNGVANGEGRNARKADNSDRRRATTIARAEGVKRHHARIAVNKAAIEAAPAELKRMMDENFFNAEVITDLEGGALTLKFLVAVIMDSTQATKDRLNAAKTLAEFTKAKPVSKSEVAIKNAEDFLDTLTAKM